MGGTKRMAAVLLGALGLLAFGGCRVADSDVKRWETTEHGPFKLVAVIEHDKYSWELRTEAAMSLIRMPPRGGVRQGIGYLIDHYKDEDGQQREGALNVLSEESRRTIVDKMAPDLIHELEPPPPARTPEGRLPADLTIPFKDAAFAMLTHEPPLVANDQTKAALKAALIKWSQTGFEDRVENGSQQYGLEQMMHFLGVESVKTLPNTINENTARLDRIAGLVNDVGDDATKIATSQALVALAQKYNSKEWLDAQTKVVKESNAKNNIKADDTQVAGQVDKIQERRLTEEVFPAMKKVGGKPAIDYLFQYAADPSKVPDRRKLALAALEGHIDKNNPADLERLYALVKSDETPDAVRDVAFARMAELPKEQFVPKLYTLFEPKKWKVRWEAGDYVLKSVGTKQIPEFMAHLPRSNVTKMGMTEPLTYGGDIKKMEQTTQPGDPKPYNQILPYLASKDIGPKLTALGFFWEGAKKDRAVVQPYAEDPTPLPKCEKEDECSWSCDVPKTPGSKETEPHELKTIGDFVRLCLIPTMEK